MTSLGSTRAPWVTGLLASLVVLAALDPAFSCALQYDRAALRGGEAWRLLSAHLVHWDVRHLGWDLLAFLACGTVAELIQRRRFVVTLFSAALVTSGVIVVFAPGCLEYRGLSAVNSALYSFAALTFLQRGRAARDATLIKGALLALAVFAAKTTLDLTTGPIVFDPASAGFVSMPWVHLTGALVGAALAAPAPATTPPCLLLRDHIM